ncbi:MAG: L-serine ammonia-lyase, iron-sulfur-dependent, subunit alpha [Elusimicrobia bacterium]|nr:L-serine ammonia-lyase, iron-sulfur-dependent, subunit alpha [Elusimicrobiota bacterium]
MDSISILNDVLGPIMRGPSSSHTAGPYHISVIARNLLNEEPVSVTFRFDPQGSFANVYEQQGSDLGFIAGIVGIEMTNTDFTNVKELANKKGIKYEFIIKTIPEANHPNTVVINLTGKSGKKLAITAQSIGGGSVIITHIEQCPVKITGQFYNLVLVISNNHAEEAKKIIDSDGLSIDTEVLQYNKCTVLQSNRTAPVNNSLKEKLKSIPGFVNFWETAPIFFVKKGKPLFYSAQEIAVYAEKTGLSLGKIGLEYEANLLGLKPDEVIAEVLRRFSVMRSSIEQGLQGKAKPRLFEPFAKEIFDKESAGRLRFGGYTTRAAARALAVMHVSASSGIICAAPTAGSAGVLPAVVVTLDEILKLSQEKIALTLLAASTIGVIVATRATFAAEQAGCQVEIGTAGAMAAASAIEAADGNVNMALDAASVCFQNTMGLICDPVKGFAEIPCHSRNAVAASNAFVVADLIMGGYKNLIPLDETIDALFQVGKMMPREHRCTALGGLSITPSAQCLKFSK